MAKGDATLASLGTFKTHYGFKIKPFTVTCDAAYKTGGYAVDLSNRGVDTIWCVTVLTESEQHGYDLRYDATAKTLKAYYADYNAVADGDLIEVADAATLSSGATFDIRVLLMGSGK